MASLRFFLKTSGTDESTEYFRHGLHIRRLSDGTLQCRQSGEHGQIVPGKPTDIQVELSLAPLPYLQSYPLADLPTVLKEVRTGSNPAILSICNTHDERVDCPSYNIPTMLEEIADLVEDHDIGPFVFLPSTGCAWLFDTTEDLRPALRIAARERHSLIDDICQYFSRELVSEVVEEMIEIGYWEDSDAKEYLLSAIGK